MNIDYNNSAKAYQYVLKSYPRGSQNTQPISNSCERPWKVVTIDSYSNCMLCSCDGWLPIPVGKITDFDRLEDIWDNPIAKKVQQDIADKKFTNCAVEHCGIKHTNIHQKHYEINFAIDDSCNLQCPSCRRDKRMHDSGPVYEEKLRAFQHCVDLLNKFEHKVHVIFSSSGDPLASHISRPMLQSYKGKENQTFTLFTNGLLMKKQLPKTALLEKIIEYRISVDAGSEAVYKKVRVGGDWNVLMENFDFLQDYLTKTKIKKYVNLNFTCQKNNYQDLPNFINLCEKYNFNGLVTELNDWGTWNKEPVETPDAWTILNGTYLDHNVLDPRHPEYKECRKIVKECSTSPLLKLTPRLVQLLDLHNGS